MLLHTWISIKVFHGDISLTWTIYFMLSKLACLSPIWLWESMITYWDWLIDWLYLHKCHVAVITTICIDNLKPSGSLGSRSSTTKGDKTKINLNFSSLIYFLLKKGTLTWFCPSTSFESWMKNASEPPG